MSYFPQYMPWFVGFFPSGQQQSEGAVEPAIPCFDVMGVELILQGFYVRVSSPEWPQLLPGW